MALSDILERYDPKVLEKKRADIVARNALIERDRYERLNLESIQGLKNEAGPFAAPNIGKGLGVYSMLPLPEYTPPAPIAPVTPPVPAKKELLPSLNVIPAPTKPPSAPVPVKLASEELSGYMPTTFAGALIQHGETKRQSKLQQTDNENALAAYDAAGKGEASVALRGLQDWQGQEIQSKVAQQKQIAELQTELLNPATTTERRQYISQALHGPGTPPFEPFPTFNDATGLRTGTSVLNRITGALTEPGRAKVTAEDALAAVKAGASKVEVNKRLVAAGLAPI